MPQLTSQSYLAVNRIRPFIDSQLRPAHLRGMLISDVIRAFHETMPPPAMAPIVVEQSTRSSMAERYAERTSGRLRAFETDVIEFCAASRSLMTRLETATRSGDVATDYAEMSEFIDYLERTAERLAKDDARSEKDSVRDVKRVQRTDPALALAVRKAVSWQEELSAQMIEAMLQLALQARAFRSTLREPTLIQTFDDADELMRRLDEAMAG